MVTTIGNTNAKIVVSDHATPSSAVYALYIEPLMVREQNRLPYLDNMNTNLASGISLGIKMYAVDIRFEFIRFEITSKTDYDNLRKALSYWEKNNNLLYLNVENEWNGNLATWGSYDNPTTLGPITGQIVDFMTQIKPQSAECSFAFKRVSKTSGGA